MSARHKHTARRRSKECIEEELKAHAQTAITVVAESVVVLKKSVAEKECSLSHLAYFKELLQVLSV